jgi:heptosyltransferase-2
VEERILVVKLAAAGDVLRTTPLLPAFKATHPRCWITWLTDGASRFVLEGNPLIDELLSFDEAGILPLLAREFDWVVVLDKEPRAAALGNLVRSHRKTGFGLSGEGKPVAMNKESLYALRLGLDDNLKFRVNRKTYPEIIFEMCSFTYGGEEYIFRLAPAVREAAEGILREGGWRPDRVTVGLNTGCGDMFATKKWTEEGFIDLAGKLVRETGVQVVLLGGPEERERNRRIRENLEVPVVDTGTGNPPDVFAGLVEGCRIVVTADTLALHLAIALKKEIVLLMGPTASAEIELFGRGEILSSDMDCAPCYLQTCSREAVCMTAISPEMVLEAVVRRLEAVERKDRKA